MRVKMLKFLAKRDYNFVDVGVISTATTFFNTQHYWYAALLLRSGLVLSIYLEHKAKE